MKMIALLGIFLVPSVSAQEPKFDLADVHISTTPQNFAQNFGGVLRAGRYINREATMLDLISAAYGVSQENVAGGPGWVESDLFDVVAKVPNGTTGATANLMLQSLLADRFGLVLRHDTQPMPRYVLTVGKGGSKLKASSGTGNPDCQSQPQQPGGRGGDQASIPNNRVTCHNLTSAAIADNLRQMAGGYFDHDVIDQTNLEGTWDFDLEWTSRGALAAKGAEGISAFDAVEKQLGLKAELKNVPMSALVIQSVNRRPTANAPLVATVLATEPARFEAAAIKPADPDNTGTGLNYTGGSQMRATGTLRGLIAMALQIQPNVAGDVVVGLPKSADAKRWDILAKVPSTGEGAPNIVGGRPQPPPIGVAMEMLRGLLLERFELKFHTENREVTVYALVRGSGKPKLTPAGESERSGCKTDPSAPKPVPNMNSMLACKNLTMAELADNLQAMATAYIDHPIVDATGLQGAWDFLIGWTPRRALQSQATTGAEAADPNGISIFEAVDRELGLKLVKQTRSIPVTVVDHVDEAPID